jgi:quinol monooxygenase YgiN
MNAKTWAATLALTVSGFGLALAGFSLVDLEPMARAADAPAQAPSAAQGPLYVTTYVEVAPDDAAQASALLKTYRDAARKDSGATEIDIFQEEGHSSRFVLDEIWKDQQAFDAHDKAPELAALRDGLKPLEFRALDTRPHTAYLATPPRAPKAGDVFVIAHLDVFGPGLAPLLAAMKPLDEATVKQPGMVRYELLQQTVPHANHFRIFEEWASEKDWVAHNKAAATHAFLDSLGTYLGTPYDQRLYHLVE